MRLQKIANKFLVPLPGLNNEFLVATQLLDTYVMQSALIPASVCYAIDKRVRQFIWGSTLEKKVIHLIMWDTVIQKKGHGGLGLKQMRAMTLGMMAKLGWRLFREKDSLWSRILTSNT